MLVDTHCHLDVPPLFDHLRSYLAGAREAGVRQWIVPALHPGGWRTIADLSRQHGGIYAAFGIHPRHAGEVSEADLERLRQVAGQGVAIGEVGLDRRSGHPERQEELFRRQIGIARELGLPLLVHCCGMIGKTLATLREEQAHQVGGIIHGYSGSLESAREFVRLGFALSPGDNLLRRNTDKPRRLLQALPLSWLVLESDAPSPETGAARNRPDLLRQLAETVAALSGSDVDEVVRETARTAWRLMPRLGRQCR